MWAAKEVQGNRPGCPFLYLWIIVFAGSKKARSVTID